MTRQLTVTRQLQDFVEARGLSLAPLLRQVGVASPLWRERLELSAEEYVRLLDAVGERVTDEQVLAMSDVRQVQGFLPVLYAALCSACGRDAVDRLAQYKRIMGPVSVQVAEAPGEVGVVMRAEAPVARLPRVLVLSEQLLLVGLLRVGSGTEVVPVRVESPYAYDPVVARYLGAVPRKGRDCRVVLRASDLRLPFATRNNVMLDYLEPELRRRLAVLEADPGLVPALRRELFSAIPAGRFSVAQVARSLGTSPRSLQRALAEAGTTFRGELRQVQQKLAEYHLRDASLSTADVALLSGYQSTASLMRAFRQWTGMTVGEFRAASQRA